MSESQNPLLSHRNRKNDSILPFVAQYFKSVSDLFRSRVVSWSSQDIPIRVALVDSTNIARLLDNPEFGDSVIYSALRVRGIPVEGCVMMAYSLFAKLVEVSLSGDGNSDVSSQVRNLTMFERNFANRMLEELIEQMTDAWEHRKPIEVEFRPPSLNPPNWGPKAKTMEVLTATIDVGPLTAPYGLMAIALPAQLFERVYGFSLRQQNDVVAPSFENVMDVQVDMVAELQRVTMTVDEIRSLELGTMIPLSDNLSVSLLINGLSRFVGELGERGGFRSVRITEVNEVSGGEDI